MPKKYLIDTCIWRDFYENRLSKSGKHLGGYATELFMKVLNNRFVVLFSDLLINELMKDYSEEEVSNMLDILFISNLLQKVDISEEDYTKAKEIAKQRNLPAGDVLHAIIAKKNCAILVSQDKHFQELKDIAEVKLPEEI